MANNEKHMHEPLVQVSKRDTMPWYKSWGVRLIAIVLALVICAFVIVLLTGYNPIKVYTQMFKGTFGSPRKVWNTVQKLAMLLCISLAVTPAFKMKFWNIGAEGQTLSGGLASAAMMICFGNTMPPALLIPLMAIAAIAAGMVWGLIPAIFKAQWKTNETLFTLMMNYVAIQLVEYFLKIADKSGSNVVGPDLLSHGWLPDIFGVKYLLNIIIVAVITVLMQIYLKYSKHGYEISVVGESENTARYIGINVKKVIIRTMLVSGAICGLAGLLLVGGSSHSIDSNLVGGRGFTAIMVSWLGKFNPITMILTTLLLVFLGRGADEVTSKFGLNGDFSDILTGIILFFIIGCEFFINYKINFSRRKKEEK